MILFLIGLSKLQNMTFYISVLTEEQSGINSCFAILPNERQIFWRPFY